MKTRLYAQALFSLGLFAASCMLSAADVRADDTAALIKQGRNKAQICTRCHGRFGIQQAAEQAGMGNMVGIFVERQLGDFASGLRQQIVMSAVVQSLSEEDIKAIVAWLDSVPSH